MCTFNVLRFHQNASATAYRLAITCRSSTVRSLTGFTFPPYSKLHGKWRPQVAITASKSLPAFKRSFWGSLPSILVPPVVFTSLLVGLWTYKCVMTILFQDKIIYMPYMPPFARKERVEDYAAACAPVAWRHMHIRSTDGTRIALCVGKSTNRDLLVEKSKQLKRKRVVICYCQGNGSSTPPRLPLLSNTLKAVEAQATLETSDAVEFVVVALSYRGYWTSKGRASQQGIEKDAQAMLNWVCNTQDIPHGDLEIILWGQSIGAGVAATAAASYIAKNTLGPMVTGLILETPFTGIKSMLLALYPQKWLPYQYLWPFLWNHWDSEAALRGIGKSQRQPRILIVPATRDEVVPPSEADKLEHISRDAGLETQRTNIIGALHTEATTRREGQTAVAAFVVDVVKPSQ